MDFTNNPGSTSAPPTMDELLAAAHRLRSEACDFNVRMTIALAKMKCQRCGYVPRLDATGGAGRTVLVCEHMYGALIEATTDPLDDVRYGGECPLSAMRIVIDDQPSPKQ